MKPSHDWILAYWDSAGRGASRDDAARYADELMQYERELDELQRAILAAGLVVACHDLGALL